MFFNVNGKIISLVSMKKKIVVSWKNFNRKKGM